MGAKMSGVRSWLDGREPRDNRGHRLEEMYLTAPAREPVEALGLWRPENMIVALRVLKRKLGLSILEVGDMVGIDRDGAWFYLNDMRRPNPKYVRRAAEICQEHGITAEDMESERRQPRMFDKRHESIGPSSRNYQIVFSGADPSKPLWEILREAQAATNMIFKDIAAEMGISVGHFYLFSTSNGCLPNSDLQTELFAHLERAYAAASLKFPLVLEPERRNA